MFFLDFSLYRTNRGVVPNVIEFLQILTSDTNRWHEFLKYRLRDTTARQACLPGTYLSFGSPPLLSGREH